MKINKREAAKRLKIEAEKSNLMYDLRLLAVGATATMNYEDDPSAGIFIFQTVGIEAWARWVDAIGEWWQIGRQFEHEGQKLERNPWMMRPDAMKHYESLESACEYLHSEGARAGGEWEAR